MLTIAPTINTTNSKIRICDCESNFLLTDLISQSLGRYLENAGCKSTYYWFYKKRPPIREVFKFQLLSSSIALVESVKLRWLLAHSDKHLHSWFWCWIRSLRLNKPMLCNVLEPLGFQNLTRVASFPLYIPGILDMSSRPLFLLFYRNPSVLFSRSILSPLWQI